MLKGTRFSSDLASLNNTIVIESITAEDMDLILSYTDMNSVHFQCG